MEDRVLMLVTRAKTNKEIARDLVISDATVKRHMENLLRKLKLRNRIEAAIYGLMVKGLPAPDRSIRAFERDVKSDGHARRESPADRSG